MTTMNTTLDATALADRVKSPYLEIPETEAELKASVEQAVKPEEEAKPAGEDPRQKDEYSFDLEYIDGRNNAWKGRFTNKILTIRERQLSGIMRARLAGGVPAESLDPLTAELNLIISHLTFSLTARPDWAKDLQSLNDIQLLQAIYTEVASHEAGFFGWSSVASEEDLRK